MSDEIDDFMSEPINSDPDVAFVGHTDKATLFLLALSNAHNFTSLIIDKCPSTSAAVSMMTKRWFIQKITQKMKVIVIKIKINKSFDWLNNQQLEMMSENYANKSVVITFETSLNEDDDEKFHIYWKTSDCQQFLKLELQKTTDKAVEMFVVNFIIQSVNAAKLGLSVAAQNQLSSLFETSLEPIALADSRGFDLLMIAAREGNESVVNYLLGLGFDVNNCVDDETPASLAFKNKHNNTLLILLKANSLFPDNFHLHNSTNEIKEFVEMSQKIHNFIARDQIEEVEGILTENSHLRHFYNTSNVSAPAAAAMRGKIEIYKLFLKHNVFISPKEDINTILKNLKTKHRENMRLIHLEHAKDFTHKHLMILLTNSFVGHDIKDADEKLNTVSEAFTFLNAIPLISLILRVVAASRDFKIIFDFNRDSIQHLDPTADKNTRGIYYTTRHIYIAARYLLYAGKQIEAYATIAHELCHYALHLVYKNLCLPYFKNDPIMQSVFIKVLKDCQQKMKDEMLIWMVFDKYEKDYHEAELIVRVPHMVVQYDDDRSKLETCKEKFDSLFQFFEKTTMPDMENALPNIEVKAENDFQKFMDRRKMKKRNNRILMSLAIINAVLLISAIGFALLFGRQEVYECKSLSNDLKTQLNNSLVNSQGLNVKFGELIGVDSEACFAIKRENMSQIVGIMKENIKNNQHQPVYSIGESVKFFDEDSYVQRNFTDKNNTQYNSLSILQILEEEKIIIIQGNTGDGKETALRFMANRLKKSDNLVFHLKLKNLSCALSIYKAQLNLNLSDFLVNDVLKIQTETEKIIFKEFYKQRKLIFLWYGVDEVNVVLKESTLNLLTKFQDMKFTQVISTRPRKIDESLDRLKAEILTILPFTEDDRREFIIKAIKKNNSDEEFINKKLQSIENFIKPLRADGKSKDHFEIFTTPLMLEHIVNYQLNSDSNSTSNNLYDFYVDFIEERFKKSAKKSETTMKNESLMEVMKLHALKTMIQSKKFIPDISTRGRLDVSSIIATKNLNIVDNGILIEDSHNNFNFIHHTFCPLFITKYFIDDLWNLNDESVTKVEVKLRLKLLFYVAENIKYEFNFVNEFFNEFAANKTTGKFSDSVRDLMMNDFKFIFDGFYKNKSESIAFLSKFFEKDSEILNSIWLTDQNGSFFFRYLRRLDGIEEILSVIKKTFDADEIDNLKILKGTNQDLNIYYKIWTTKSTSSIDLLMNVTELKISEKNLDKLHLIENFYDFIKISNFTLNEIREFFNLHGFDHIKEAKNVETLKQIIKIAEEKAEIEVKDLIFKKSLIGDQTLLFSLISEESVAKTQYFIEILEQLNNNGTIDRNEMKEFLTHRSSTYHETFMTQCLTKASNSENVEMLWNMTLKFLDTKNEEKEFLVSNKELNFFRLLLRNSNYKVVMVYLNNFKNLYETEEIEEILKTDEANLLDWTKNARSDICEELSKVIIRNVDCTLSDG